MFADSKKCSLFCKKKLLIQKMFEILKTNVLEKKNMNVYIVCILIFFQDNYIIRIIIMYKENTKKMQCVNVCPNLRAQYDDKGNWSS